MIGKVEQGSENKYWQFPLKGGDALKLRSYIYWFARLCVIFVVSIVYCIAFHSKKRAIRQELVDIYPTSPYPIVLKTLELALFRKYKLRQPSLELATGDGYFTNLLYEGSNAKLNIASDLTYETLLQAKRFDFWQKMAIIDASDIPLPDNCLETVFMNNLIHHLPDRGTALAEAGRVLTKGGLFLFTDNMEGWATSHWHIKRREGKKDYQEKLDRFLNQGIQCLIKDAGYWYGVDKTGEWKVREITPIFSNRSMYWLSIFETLNAKMGSPTRKPIRDILDCLPMLKWWQEFMIRCIAGYFVEHDEELCRKYGATSLFIALEKTSPVHVGNIINYACPVCKESLVQKDTAYFCGKCHEAYPVVDGVPFLISYLNGLPLNEYIKRAKTNQSLGVSC